MQCNRCEAPLALDGMCQRCASVSLAIPRRTRMTRDTDISGLTTLLISLPFLLIALLRSVSDTSGSPVPIAMRGLCGATFAGLIVAWLCSRLFKAHFRLTWVVVFGALFAIQSAQPLLAYVHSSAPKIAYFNVSWPPGWTVLATDDEASAEEFRRQGVAMEIAVVQDSGGPVARAVALHETGPAPLDQTLGRIIEGEMKGETMAVSTSLSKPEEIRWLGRPALQQDVVFGQAGKFVRQRVFITQNDSGLLVCALVYSAGGANFEKYLPALQSMKSELPCS